MHTLGPTQRTASNLQARWRHRNGSYRWLERNMLVLLGEEGQVFGFRGSDRDFTERRPPGETHQPPDARAQDALRRQRRDAAHPPAARDPGGACRLATSVGGYASAMVALIEPGTRTARPAAWSGAFDQQLATQLTFTITDSAADDTSVTGRVLRTGTPLVCNDVQTMAIPLAARATLMDQGFPKHRRIPAARGPHAGGGAAAHLL
jgi:hypothetical protein